MVHFVDLHSLFYDLSNRKKWIQGRIWILEHHLHSPGQLLGLFFADPADILAVKKDFSCVRLIDTQQGSSHRSLSTAGLSNQS